MSTIGFATANSAGSGVVDPSLAESADAMDQPPIATAPAARPPVIRLEGLSKQYAEAGQARLILDSLDLDFAAGEFVCLIGQVG